MGSALLIATSTNNSGFATASVTRFGGLVGSGTNVSQNSGTVRAQVETTLAVGGTLTNYSLYAVSNARTTNTIFSACLNGAGSALTVTYGSGIFGTLQDTSHSVSVSQNDTLCEQGVSSTGVGAIVVCSSAVNFAASSGTVGAFSQVFNNGNTYSGSGPITDFCPLVGIQLGSITEVDQQFSNPVAGTASYLQMCVLTNGRSTSTAITFRNTGVSGNQTVTFGAGVIGIQTDTTHTDAIAAGDKITSQLALGTGTGNFTVTMAGFHQTATNVGESGCSLLRNRTLAAGATTYSVICGSFNPNATEVNMTGSVGTSGVASKLWVRVPTGGNASTTNSTVKFRIGAANGNQVVTITALTAGDYQDTTNSDTFNATDLIDYQFTGATTGAVTYTALSMLLYVAPPVAANNNAPLMSMLGVGA